MPEVLCGSHRDANWSFQGTAAFESFVTVQVSDSAVAPSCGFSSNKLKEYKPLNNAALILISPLFRSMSMFDMRCEEEAASQPHSKARHEKLQNVHNQLKEDETRWQDVSMRHCLQCWPGGQLARQKSATC